MADLLAFVQFPHPGGEHRPKSDSMAWNRGPHARKFLKASARYLTDGKVERGAVALWGEWEAQSRIIETFPRVGLGLPRWLHDPYWQVPRHTTLLQNTDPLVFGDRFLYSNCRQQRNEKLRRLAPGSVIAFGSRLGDAFVLDTLLVVSSSTEFSAESGGVEGADWVQSVVFDPLMRGGPNKWPFSAYWGATHDDAPMGPFSFAPCLPYEPGASAFARPAIRLSSRWVQPKLAMGAKVTPATSNELGDLWANITDQVVHRDGLQLATYLEPPPHLPPI